MIRVLLIAAGVVIVLVALLYFFQHRLIYFPRRYGERLTHALERGLKEIRCSTSSGDQVSYYFTSTRDTSTTPEKIWVLFGGNASLALSWFDVFSDYNEANVGFLAFDYPGYGQNSGEPTPESIFESTDKTLRELAVFLRLPFEELHNRLALLGHSLGCAAALQFAARYPVNRLIMIAPFTSMKDMAHHSVGPLLAKLLRHDYDNRTRLKEVMQSPSPPSIAIIHGEHDDIIPVEMGRELASMFPAHIDFHEIPAGDHNHIIDMQRSLLHRLMQERDAVHESINPSQQKEVNP